MKVLFQDSSLIAVQKPAGLLVHRTSMDSGESHAALQIVRDLTGQKVYPVHRLDKPTSGVLLFAFHSQGARDLGQKFMNQEVEKTYWAVVRGEFKGKVDVDHPLAEEVDFPGERTRMDQSIQEAQTHFSAMATIEIPVAVDRYPSSRYSLVEAKPKTGRRHQIRRHLKHLHHPIIGDVNHGNGKHNRFFRDHFGCARLLLICKELRFQHPETHREITIRSELCEDFQSVLHKLGWGKFVDS